MTEQEQQKSAEQFADKWKDAENEGIDSEGIDSHCAFWITLLSEVYGIENAENFVRFGTIGSFNFIDAFIPDFGVLIEQKSKNKDLKSFRRESDAVFQNLLKNLDKVQKVTNWRYFVSCKYDVFVVYRVDEPEREPDVVRLEELGKEYKKLAFLVGR